MEEGKYFIRREAHTLYGGSREIFCTTLKEIQDIYKKSYLDCQLFMSNFITNPDGKMPGSKEP